jgi:hypothetical protein
MFVKGGILKLPFSFFVEMLVLSKNVLQGSIPEWIGDSWSRLNALAIDGNLFQGTLPSSFLALTNLRELTLQTPI